MSSEEVKVDSDEEIQLTKDNMQDGDEYNFLY